MPEDKTHREAKHPQISARYLADYMAASETKRRTIVRGCKFIAIARVVQHDEAKAIVSKFIRERNPEPDTLRVDADRLRNRLTDSEFERDLYDHNADYIDRFAQVSSLLTLPAAELLMPGKSPQIVLNGVKVTSEIHFRLRRVTRTNKVRVGAAMLRYAKRKPLPLSVAEWQSAFLYGLLADIGVEDGAEPERQLCLTVDAYSGTAYPAPTDSSRRYQNMAAACASIGERWPNIEPPPNARL